MMKNTNVAIALSAIALTTLLSGARYTDSVQEIDYKEKHHQELLAEIAILESGNKNIPCAYSDTCSEIGVYQYKPDTWKLFQRMSGMHWLSIYEEQDQRHMTDWALRNGLEKHWTTHKKAEQNIVIKKYKK
jgi:hypothetical protein